MVRQAAGDAVNDALTMARQALALVESEPDRAEDLARRALAAIPEGDDPQARSVALQALGMVAWERQAVPEAISHLRAAIDVAGAGGEIATAARARAYLAIVLSYSGDDAGALAESQTAAAVLDGADRAELQHHMAGILDRQGQLRDALDLATRALATFRRRGDPLWQAKALNNRGIILAELGQVSAAARQLATAERLYDELGMTLGRLRSRSNRAWLAALGGDVSQALQLHDGLQRELAVLGVPSGLFRLDHAAVLLSASLHSEAQAAAERAAAELGTVGMPLDRAEALLLGAVAARLGGSFDDAERLGHEALAAFQEQGRPSWTMRAQHELVEVAWTTGRNDAGTEALARRVADELDAAGWRGWACDVHLLAGEMALERGDVAEAEARLERAKIHHRHSASSGTVAHAAALRARLLIARGDPAEAHRVVRRALRVLEDQESLLGATELRVRGAGRAAELADLGLQWALAAGRPASILGWAERRRAASLRVPAVRPPRDRELARLLVQRRAAVMAVEQLERAELPTAPDPAPYQRIALLDHEIRSLARTARGTRLGRARSAIKASAVAAALVERALIELVAVGDDLGVVVVTDRRRLFRPLASLRDVRRELDHVRFAMARATVGPGRPGHDPLTVSLEALDELVGAPLLQWIGGREVVVVPVAALHTLPWGSLPSLRDRPVTIAPSATTWLAAASRRRERRDRGVVVVAGPGLAHAETEALAVSRIAGAATTLIGDAATAGAVLRAIEGASAVHLACHGRFHAENPLLSSLRLADGPLTVYELERVRRAPHLVILSACDSAITAASVGNELMGLTSTLLTLGCRTLVGAVAPVVDASIIGVMTAFHEQLAAGHTPAAALATARAAVPPDDRVASATAVALGCFGLGR